MPPTTQPQQQEGAPVPLPKDNDNNSVVGEGTADEKGTSKKNGTTATGNPKRQKIVKACKDCRRRKVKCDGATPCGTCKRSSIQCIFESTSPKRSTSKHYIESLENRLFVMEKAVNSLGGTTAQLIKEAVKREEEQQQLLLKQKQQQQLQQKGLVTQQHQLQQQQDATPLDDMEAEEEDIRYMMNEFGSPNYISDISCYLDFQQQVQQQQQQSQSTTATSSPKSENSSTSSITTTRYNNNTTPQDEIEIQNHLKFYLIQIQPYFPLFIPSYFNRQYANHELPKILIYSMCALSCLFQQLEEHYSYYQRAMIMLDEAIGRPSIPLIQTLLLLIKYKEQTNEKGYFEKTKSLMARTIEIAQILKLNQIPCTSNNDGASLMIETRKRTWCMVFTYNTLLCVEQGIIQNDFMYINNDIHLPTTVLDESSLDCSRYIIQFSSTLDQIHKYILKVTKRQEIQKDLRDEQQILEENMSLFHLQVRLENDLMHLPCNLIISNLNYKQQSQLDFPAQDIMLTVSPMTRLLHLIHHLNLLLLHFHYTKYPLPIMQQDTSSFTVYQHRQICLHSASNTIRLVEGLISDPTQSYRYISRGLQFICHCITFSFTILQYEVLGLNNTRREYLDEYKRCAQLLQQVASASPSVEMKSLVSSPLDLDVSVLKVSSPSSLSPTPTAMLSYPSTTASSVSSVSSNLVQSPTSTVNMENRQQKRRNTISHRPPPPTALLQLSSTNVVNHLHHPLHNIHATPLQPPQPPPPTHHQLLRGSSQSCNDLRSLNRMHAAAVSSTSPIMNQQYSNNAFTQHRKPVGSVISSSTSTSTNAPYRHGNGSNSSLRGGLSPISPTTLPYSKPSPSSTSGSVMSYETAYPSMTQSTGFPTSSSVNRVNSIQQVGKVRRIKKSQSIHGISSTYRQQQLLQQQQYQLYQQQQQQVQAQQFQFQQQLNNLLIPPSASISSSSGLHRPYQPTFDDFSISNKYGVSVEDEDMTMLGDFAAATSMNNVMVNDLNFLNNYHQPMEDTSISRSEGHHLL